MITTSKPAPAMTHDVEKSNKKAFVVMCNALLELWCYYANIVSISFSPIRNIISPVSIITVYIAMHFFSLSDISKKDVYTSEMSSWIIKTLLV